METIRKIVFATLTFCLLNVQLIGGWQGLRFSMAGQDSYAQSSSSSASSVSTGTFQGQKIETQQWLTLITLLAIATVGAALLKSCVAKNNIELYIFAAGALAFIAGEVIS
ncbi:MAG: hypothetical protein WCG27_08695, partial [Pseudomonadota bacterium]